MYMQGTAHSAVRVNIDAVHSKARPEIFLPHFYGAAALQTHTRHCTAAEEDRQCAVLFVIITAIALAAKDGAAQNNTPGCQFPKS